MKYKVGDVIRFKTLTKNKVEDDEGTIVHIDDGGKLTVRFPDVIEITSHTDWVEKDEITDHIPKKAAEKTARLKVGGDESIRLMKLAIKEIETYQLRKP